MAAFWNEVTKNRDQLQANTDCLLQNGRLFPGTNPYPGVLELLRSVNWSTDQEDI
jgi:hypothetical protein